MGNGLWAIVQQILGTPSIQATTPERMLVTAGAITAVYMLINGAIGLIGNVTKGGRY